MTTTPKRLYEVLVPTIYGDTQKPIRTRHHKNWDNRVKRLSGGLTILAPGRGLWVFQGDTFREKVIPVRIFCTEKVMKKVVDITLQHYRPRER